MQERRFAEVYLKTATPEREHAWYRVADRVPQAAGRKPEQLEAALGQILLGDAALILFRQRDDYAYVLFGPVNTGQHDRAGRNIPFRLLLEFSSAGAASTAFCGMLHEWWGERRDAPPGLPEHARDLIEILDGRLRQHSELEGFLERCLTRWNTLAFSQESGDLSRRAPLRARTSEARLAELAAYLQSPRFQDVCARADLQSAHGVTISAAVVEGVVAEQLAGIWRAVSDLCEDAMWEENPEPVQPVSSASEEPLRGFTVLNKRGRTFKEKHLPTVLTAFKGVAACVDRQFQGDSLCVRLRDPDPEVRKLAAEELVGRRRTVTAVQIDELGKLLDRETVPKVLRAAIHALEELGPQAAAAVPKLQTLVADPSVGEAAQNALRRIRGQVLNEEA